mgnify:CR=1 FL=1
MEATQPESFPDPLIRASKFRRVNVFVNGCLERRAVIESGSGNFYEIGTTLKKAIFGQVVQALLITPSSGNSAGNNGENDTFVRTAEERAIKIYSKRTLRALQGRTAENPLIENNDEQIVASEIERDLAEV